MKSFFAHPHPIPDVFIGREEEMDELARWLGSDRSILVMHAIGGMGKSTLARAWSEQVVQGQQSSGDGAQSCPAVFWWSFYEQDGGFRNFLGQLAEWLQDREPAGTVFPAPNLGEIFERLKARSHLLVLDGFERELRAFAPVTQPDEGTGSNECTDPLASEFLRLLSSERTLSHVLLTSRVVPVEFGSTSDHVMLRPLEGLSDRAVVEFFRAKGIHGTEDELIGVSARFGHHPLALQLLAGRVKAAGLTEIAVARTWDVMPMLQRRTAHILYHAMRDLPVGESSLLRLLCASPENISYSLAEKATRHQSDLSLMLQKLEQRGLVSVADNLIVIHPVVRIHVVQELHVSPDDHLQIAQAIINGGVVEELAARDGNLGNRLTYHLSRAQQYQVAISALFHCYNEKFYIEGDYEAIISATDGFFQESGGEGALQGDFEIFEQTYLLTVRSNCFEKIGNYKEAERILTETLTLDHQGGNPQNIGITSLNLVRTLMLRGKLRKASEVINSIPSESLLKEQVAARRDLFGGLLRAILGDATGLRMTEAAVAFFRNQYRVSPDLRSAQGFAVSLAYSAEASLELGYVDQALAFAHLSRQLADESGARREIARSMVAVVTCMSRGDPKQDQLLNFIDEALLVTRTTQQHEFEIQALLTKASVLQSIGFPQQSLRVALEALRRSVQTELPLKKTESHLQLAQLHLQLGRPTDAEFHLGKAIGQLEADPDFAARRLLDLTTRIANELRSAPVGD